MTIDAIALDGSRTSLSDADTMGGRALKARSTIRRISFA
jgi:hypothetical protein